MAALLEKGGEWQVGCSCARTADFLSICTGKLFLETSGQHTHRQPLSLHVRCAGVLDPCTWARHH
jgi:hypothetical protein